MSIADVRAAFILAGAGQLSLHDAAMRHVGDGAHVLQFTGAHRDGARFDHVSPPFSGDPDQRARESAAELIATRAKRDSHMTAATTITQQEDKSMPAPAPIAGLAGTLRDQLTQATARADQVARRAKDSVTNLHQVLDAAEGTVQQLDAAASDIQAALGLSTNGGPALTIAFSGESLPRTGSGVDTSSPPKSAPADLGTKMRPISGKPEIGETRQTQEIPKVE
jgi:hypothetical protein